MGLDTSHNAWHGSYNSFYTFRRSLAKLIDIDLDQCLGFGGTMDLESIKHDLIPLLNHSDCDGELSVKEAEQIVKGLDLIVLNIHKTGIPYIGFIDQLIRFRDGCKLAIKLNEPIDFH